MNAAYGFVVALRETIEAALVIGIVLGCLARIGRTGLKRYIWYGVVAAGLASVALAEISIALGGAMHGAAERVFESGMLLLAVAVLTSMIVWMQRQSRTIKADITARVAATVRGPALNLALLSFVMTFREGVETVILLRGAMAVGPSGGGLPGATLGMAAALAFALLFFRSAKRMDLRRFFTVSGYLMLIFAAGLLANWVDAMETAGILPAVLEPLWDTNRLIAGGGTAGSFLHALLGYDPRPSLSQVLVWGGYLAGFGSWYRRGINV